MARAHEHLASARYAEAAGAFRAVLRIDPNEFQAHFGLADALVARGQHAEAVEGLVAAAESCTAREDNGAALTLYGKALAVDPMRLELHLDVAMAEAALGRMEAAQSRLEHLAEVYMQAGRTDEAAEVYRCLAGWEGEGEEIEPEPEEVPAAVQRRVTEVPGATAQPLPRDAVPMAVSSSETMVISTILITPDGQLYQMPSEQQAEAWAPTSGDTVPPVPDDMLEVVHSAPLELAEGEEIEGVERTVVGFPPPPPSLPEGYESAAHTVDRAALEDAVVAALDNLAQLEEEDATLVMQRLPPNHKLAALRRAASGESRLPEFVTRSRMPKPELPPEPEPELAVEEELAVDEDLAADEDLQALEELETAAPEPEPESKLRIRPAPRPVTKTPAPLPGMGPQPVAGKPAAAASKAAAPSGAAKPGPAAAASGTSRAGTLGKPGAPAGAASKPAVAAKPAPTSRPGSASAAAKPGGVASKPVTASTPARPSGLAKPVIGGAKPSPASRPAASASPSAAKPSPASTPSTAASRPTATSRPGATPASSAAARPNPSQRPTSGTIKSSVTSSSAATSKPAPATKPSAPVRSTPASASAAARPSPALGTARPSSGEAGKPTRPDNPLAERLRRRAGLQRPDAAPGRAEPRPTDPRATEPIIVRSPSTLPPVNKKK